MEYVDTLILSCLGIDLDDVIISLSETNDSKSEPVNTLNKRRRAKGIKQGNAMFGLELKVEPVNDPTVPNWHDLKALRTPFTITKRENGKAITWSGCKITSVKDDRADGSSGQSVSVMCTDRDP